MGQKCPRAALTPLATASARPVLRQRVEAQTAETAQMASPCGGPTCEPAWAGLGRRAGSQRRLRRIPDHASLGGLGGAAGDRRWRSPQRAKRGRDARGIACPPPGVNWDPPAQCRRGPLARRLAHSGEALAERRDLAPVDPFALGCTARERTPSARHCSATTTRPQACRESNTCAHKGGGSERHGRHKAHGLDMDFKA